MSWLLYYYCIIVFICVIFVYFSDFKNLCQRLSHLNGGSVIGDLLFVVAPILYRGFVLCPYFVCIT